MQIFCTFVLYTSNKYIVYNKIGTQSGTVIYVYKKSGLISNSNWKYLWKLKSKQRNSKQIYVQKIFYKFSLVNKIKTNRKIRKKYKPQKIMLKIKFAKQQYDL